LNIKVSILCKLELTHRTEPFNRCRKETFWYCVRTNRTAIRFCCGEFRCWSESLCSSGIRFYRVSLFSNCGRWNRIELLTSLLGSALPTELHISVYLSIGLDLNQRPSRSLRLTGHSDQLSYQSIIYRMPCETVTRIAPFATRPIKRTIPHKRPYLRRQSHLAGTKIDPFACPL
jgi:hypothetical protein